MILERIKIRDIEAEAADVLTGFFDSNEYTFPIPIEDIAESQGLAIQYGKFSEDDVSGILRRNNGQGQVYVSSDEPRYRQVFTIAHELGHFLLHANTKPEEVLYRKDTITLTREDRQIESEANWFAAAMLMPKEKFTKYWNVTHDESLLADYFGVSPTAIRLRIKNLGLE